MEEDDKVQVRVLMWVGGSQGKTDIVRGNVNFFCRWCMCVCGEHTRKSFLDCFMHKIRF